VKHLRSVTKASPTEAALWQEIFCQMALFFSSLLESFGGSSPIVDFIEGKCDLPTQE